MTSQYQLIKQSLLEGLKRCKFDVNRLEPIRPKEGLFTDSMEVSTANGSIQFIIHSIKETHNRFHKYSKEELLDEIDIMAADYGFVGTMTLIHVNLSFRKDVSKKVQEAREALAILRNHKYYTLASREKEFREKIGEI